MCVSSGDIVSSACSFTPLKFVFLYINPDEPSDEFILNMINSESLGLMKNIELSFDVTSKAK